jgi:hypothetical protein
MFIDEVRANTRKHGNRKCTKPLGVCMWLSGDLSVQWQNIFTVTRGVRGGGGPLGGRDKHFPVILNIKSSNSNVLSQIFFSKHRNFLTKGQYLHFTATLACTKRAFLITKNGTLNTICGPGGGGGRSPCFPVLTPLTVTQGNFIEF